MVSFARLTLGTTFYTGAVDEADALPFIFQDREPIEFNALEGNSEEDFQREKWQYGVRGRYAMTYGFWQKINRTVFNN